MVDVRRSPILRTIPFLIAVCFASLPAQARYSGGTGEPNDPYQIATAADLIALGETPEDYDKHFILTADIDLDPNLPGRKVFDRAVIAPDRDLVVSHFQGTAFSGVFDGNGHTIANLTIAGHSYLGLFGLVAGPTEVEVRNIGLVNVKITGVGVKTAASSNVGGLAGCTGGCTVTNCHSTGAVSGAWYVGGLVGESFGPVSRCYSIATVTGWTCVGGLLGYNSCSTVSHCYSTGAVSGGWTCVGGLIGQNSGSSGIDYSYVGKVTDCYSTSTVLGVLQVGGLVGWNDIVACLADCYATGSISGDDDVGGLVGCNAGDIIHCISVGTVLGDRNVGGLVGNDSWCFDRNCWIGTATGCFWDTQTSGQATSAGGIGKTTAEMQTAKTFLDAGWDFVGETANGSEDIWKIADGLGYPRLSWEKYSGGTGEPNDPYQIATAADLIALGETPEDYDKHFILTADIDLDPNLPGRKVFDKAVIAADANEASWRFEGTSFTGVFDGNGHTISHLTITGKDYLGLFGLLGGARVSNLGVVDVNITGSGFCVGGTAGGNGRWDTPGGHVTCCYSTGTVTGYSNVGGLVGVNYGVVTQCYSTGVVSVSEIGGGLVGVTSCGVVTRCYSTATVSGDLSVGGLMGILHEGFVAECYSTGRVSGGDYVGGLVAAGSRMGTGWRGCGWDVIHCFWDIETSGQATSYAGTGTVKTTAEMQTASTFLDAGWDFVGETVNGTEEIWWILEGKDYPRLWWEAHD